MAERDQGRSRPALYTIPVHRAFAAALAAGLISRFGSDTLGLARGLVLLPNNRAKRAVTDAFVRASGGGLLLPRLVAIGDPAFDEAAGAMLDPADDAEPVAPAIAPLRRRLILARLVSEERVSTARLHVRARRPRDRDGRARVADTQTTSARSGDRPATPVDRDAPAIP